MEMEALREALQQQPFRPFVICLADGRGLPVAHPDSIAVGESRVFVLGPDDSCSCAEMAEITSLKPIDERAPRGDQRIRLLYNAMPFRPFIIHLADGRQIPVEQRELMAISPSGRTIVVYQSDDTSTIIDLLLVTDLETGNDRAAKEHRS